MATFFSDYFDIDPSAVNEYGAFNISIVNDLPLFIDPFLLFNSVKEDYARLHDEMINYLVFLKERAAKGPVEEGLLRLWYCFPEVKQNWLGFSVSGNRGSGLGIKFARSLHQNLHKVFPEFGGEKITEGSHLEKVCLISEGVGRDNISDFTTNLIKDHLCKFTENFATEHLKGQDVREVAVRKVHFNFDTESWESRTYRLPWINGDYVILTPKDMLTRDENWINRNDLIEGFEQIPIAIPDGQLRSQVSNYFERTLAKPKRRYPNKAERAAAAEATILQFPQIIDYYIRMKEQRGDDAVDLSAEKVLATELLYIEQVQNLQHTLVSGSQFYSTGSNTYNETHLRLSYLKDVIENKGGHRIFYSDGKPIGSEKDLQILFRLVWFGSPSDVGTEANDGRGPIDFKISRGRPDKTLVEMKLASNTKLERNLEKQLPIYQAASDARHGIKVILFFTRAEQLRAEGILDKLGLLGHKDIVLVDARFDNKPSGSKAA